LKAAKDSAACLAMVREELVHLTRSLFADADLFVVNLSSPNTPGLRSLLQCEDLAEKVLLPLRNVIRRLDAKSLRSHRSPLLVKIPPEDADRTPWSPTSLATVVGPLLASDACDGFVAVNTSSRLAAEIGEDSGGVSGAPLRPIALQLIKDLRAMIGPDLLLVGSGGITAPEHAVAFVQAGSNLVEIYSGLIYRGPALLCRCAAAIRVAEAGRHHKK
jgi:dihydroorotate dehydrogenase